MLRPFIKLCACAAFALLLCPAAAQEEKAIPPLKPSEKQAVERFISLKTEEVKKAVELHDYDYAIRLIDAILLLKPNTSCKDKLKELRLKASRETLQQNVLRVYLSCASKYHTAGANIRIKLRIKNLTEGKVVLPVYTKEARNFIVVTKDTLDYGFPFSTRMRRTQLTVKQESEIVLETGQLWEKTFDIDTSKMDRPAHYVRKYVLQAAVWPCEIITDTERFSKALTTGKLELTVAPEKELALAADALENLGNALSYINDGTTVPEGLEIDSRARADEVIFYSAFFIEDEQKGDALRLLFESLEKSAGRTSRIIMGSLSGLTGKNFGTSKEDWLKWRVENGR